jgi:hypothetical protein
VYPFICFLQRLPIKKKIFWEDLGVARKIYRNLAVMSNDEESEAEAEANMNTMIAEEPQAEDEEEGKEEELPEEKPL